MREVNKFNSYKIVQKGRNPAVTAFSTKQTFVFRKELPEVNASEGTTQTSEDESILGKRLTDCFPSKLIYHAKNKDLCTCPFHVYWDQSERFSLILSLKYESCSDLGVLLCSSTGDHRLYNTGFGSLLSQEDFPSDSLQLTHSSEGINFFNGMSNFCDDGVSQT